MLTVEEINCLLAILRLELPEHPSEFQQTLVRKLQAMREMIQRKNPGDRAESVVLMTIKPAGGEPG